MVSNGIIKYTRAIENFTAVLVVTIIVVTLLHAVIIYIQQYQTGVMANVNSGIHAMEGISLALTYLVAIGVLKLLYLDTYQGITLVIILTLVKKMVTYFLQQDIDYAHRRREVLLSFP